MHKMPHGARVASAQIQRALMQMGMMVTINAELEDENQELKRVLGDRFEVGAEGVDVDAAAALVAGVDGQADGFAALQDVDVHALDAGFVKCLVLPV